MTALISLLMAVVGGAAVAMIIYSIFNRDEE
jgi:hypothetical protein